MPVVRLSGYIGVFVKLTLDPAVGICSETAPSCWNSAIIRAQPDGISVFALGQSIDQHKRGQW